MLAISAKMQRNEAQTWTPTVPKVVDLSRGAVATDHGVRKSAFEDFFAKIEKSSYFGYKWEMKDNSVFINDMADSAQELEMAAGAFQVAFIELAV